MSWIFTSGDCFNSFFTIYGMYYQTVSFFGNPLIYGLLREMGLGIFSFASGYLIAYNNPLSFFPLTISKNFIKNG